MAASQTVKNQQHSSEVFEKKHYMERTTLASRDTPVVHTGMVYQLS